MRPVAEWTGKRLRVDARLHEADDFVRAAASNGLHLLVIVAGARPGWTEMIFADSYND